MGDRMCKCGHYESDHGDDGSCESSASTGYCPCFLFDDPDTISPDPRDAEIARLKAEVETRRIERDNARETADLRATRIERMERALAAGPAALRRMAEDYDREVVGTSYRQREVWIIRSADLINAALRVEVAQEAAMKEGT